MARGCANIQSLSDNHGMTIGDATDSHENLLRPTAQALLYTICTLRSAWMCFVEQLLLDTVASSVLAGIARRIAKRSTNKNIQ